VVEIAQVHRPVLVPPLGLDRHRLGFARPFARPSQDHADALDETGRRLAERAFLETGAGDIA
jgi:hypothetical protein